MPLFPWSSKAEDGEKLQPHDDLADFEFADEEVSDGMGAGADDDEETCRFSVFFCLSCADSASGICPFHAEIPWLY